MEFICCEFHPLSSILVYVTRKYYIVCECRPLIFLIYTVSLIIMKFICCVGHPLSSILVYVARKNIKLFVIVGRRLPEGVKVGKL